MNAAKQACASGSSAPVCISTPTRRMREHRDERAAFHCPMPPVLSTERIAHLGTAGDCRAAAFQSTL
jgi:hypothetical protein